jgi:hypothetical protein
VQIGPLQGGVGDHLRRQMLTHRTIVQTCSLFLQFACRGG